MNYTVYWVSALMALGFHSAGHALACVGEGESLSHLDTISQTVAVPVNLPKDSVLWRSDTRTLQVTCWVDQQSLGKGEYAYAYLNPYNDLGEHIELGININGVDHRASQLDRGRIIIDPHLYPGCNLPIPEVNCKRVTQHTFSFTYNYFVSKKSPPLSTGSIPEGSLSPVPNVLVAFQLDGVHGMNQIPNSNFQLQLQGLSNIRYVNCGVTMSIYPSQINFSTAFAYMARNNDLIEKQSFSVQAEKECESAAYGLDIVFNPAADATLSADKTMLIPKDNASVGIRIVSASQAAPVKFGQALEFSPRTTQRHISREFDAELRWATSQATMGPFSAGAIVDFYYK
jgi:type 1 fimbria pilin